MSTPEDSSNIETLAAFLSQVMIEALTLWLQLPITPGSTTLTAALQTGQAPAL
jgi:hypothetical protein